MRQNWITKTPPAILMMTLVIVGLAMSACAVAPVSPAATPTIDPDIYNQVPTTTVFEPGQCTAVLDSPAPAYTSSTLGGEANAEVPAGRYEVGVAADYGSSVWYMLNGVEGANFINSSSVSATEGNCAAGG
jgi:hypothetical protein